MGVCAGPCAWESSGTQNHLPPLRWVSSLSMVYQLGYTAWPTRPRHNSVSLVLAVKAILEFPLCLQGMWVTHYQEVLCPTLHSGGRHFHCYCLFPALNRWQTKQVSSSTNMKTALGPGMVAHAFSPCTWEAETYRPFWVLHQPELHETLSQTKTNKNQD